jgi:ATP-binding cassette subfamily F protein 3
MRAVLGRLRLSAPEFLLLDEPTNHLDMDSLVWLEKYLERQKCGMLIVSHDRDFLNRITNYTAEISNKSVTVYKGNYDQYQSYRAELWRQHRTEGVTCR